MKYRIHITEITTTFFEDLYKSLEWNTSDTLLLICKMKETKSDIIILNEKYHILPSKLIHNGIIRLFLNCKNSYELEYKHIIDNNISIERIEINSLLHWKGNIKYNNFYFYNLSLLEQEGLIKSDEINFYMSTTDPILRNMYLEIIINKLNKLNNGNN